ncbi:MAG: DUF2812 domain-containing protein [Clostridiales bacterium]|nr:DUF2812 domain-containing protein [Clostridiales bacterium]
MLKCIRKFFFVWDFEKEEKWLNEMAAQGLALHSIGFGKYYFEECTPGEYEIRLELLKNLPSHPQSESYLKFLESTGVEHVGSYMRWVYLRRRTANDGEFNLFSDLDSRISHVNRILTMVCIIFISELMVFVSNLGMAIMHNRMINYVVTGIILACVSLLGYATFRLWRIRKRLKQDRQIHE